MRCLVCALLSFLPGPLHAASPASASYAVAADSIDAGGRKAASAAYSQDGCLGGFGGVGTAAAPVEFAKHGYVGQLYQAISVAVSASPTNLNEGATRQLRVSAALDDATVMDLPASRVAWSVVSGPIQFVSSDGLATAARVYQDSPATVQGAYLGKLGTVGLLVRNAANDDFGAYAGDGLDDAWQVQHFGVGNPAGLASADPDHDGQNNAYEEMTGSNPLDGNSYFRFRIEPVPGHADRMNLVFSPRISGRTYAVEANQDLPGGAFAELGPMATSDAGPERTVTDLGATATNKFYRVRITRP